MGEANPVTREELAAQWQKEGFSCGLWVDPPGQVWRNYVHDVDEIVMVIEGEVEFEFDGVVHRPKPGEVLIIPAGKVHTVRNVGSGLARWYYGYRSKR
ncbi:MAG: cupin domain-containing protein [Sandaracinaceae bacterium]|nr:cupin domain-containing protein [Sandaracinaceae bacterium]MDW8245649.1 cupin domain-containing protein [Sandaracinaceae bacterium]